MTIAAIVRDLHPGVLDEKIEIGFLIIQKGE
jgi:hypothetical protein